MTALNLDHLILKQTAFNYLIMKRMVTLEAKTSISWPNVQRKEHELHFSLTVLEFLVNRDLDPEGFEVLAR